MLVRLLSLGTSVIIARVLGPEGQGIVSLTLMVPFALAVIGELGIESANVFYTSRGKIDRKYAVGNSIFLTFTWTLLLIAIFLLALPFVRDRFLQGIDIGLILIALLIFPLDFFMSSIRGVIISEHRINLYNAIFIINIALTFIFTAILVLFMNIGVYGAVIANLSGSMAGALLVYFGYLVRTRLKHALSFTDMKRQVSYGLMPYLANLFSFLNYRLDIFIISYFLDVKEVGYYAVAVALTSRLHELPQSIMTIFFPLTSAQSEEEKLQYTPNVFRKTGLLMLLVGVVIIAVARPGIVFVLGDRFLPSVMPFILLVIGRIIIRGNVGILSSDICGRGKPYIITIISSILLPISIGANIMLIPRYGIIGSAIASIIVAIIHEVMVSLAYLRVSGSYFGVLLPDFRDVADIFREGKDYLFRLFRRKR